MQKSELIKILTITKSLYGHHELTDPEIEAWWLWFGKEDAKAFYKAMQAASKGSNYFPTPGAVQKFIEKETLPDSLTWTAAEAYANRGSTKLLIKNASDFADRTVKKPMAQYGSLEELHKANQIYEATWQREFKNRFEQLQDKALAKIRSGKKYQDAILEVTAETPARQIELNENQKAVLALIKAA